MNPGASSVRELWAALFDSSLESFVTEDVQFRGLAMVLHILQLEFQKTKRNYCTLQRKYENQSREILAHDVISSDSPQLLACKNLARSPLKTICGNETTLLHQQQDVSVFEVDEDADLFNHPINEADLDKENDVSLFTDVSVDESDTPKSPKLNKSRRERSIHKARRNVLNQSADCSIIPGTPVPVLKQSKLSAASRLGVSRLPNSPLKSGRGAETSTSKCQSNATGGRFNDSDETLCSKADEHANGLVREQQAEIVRHTKKPKMDASYDRPPEQRAASPEYAYKHEAVRKRTDRLKLQGWACEDCKQYYTKFHHLTDAELQKKMDACSRHRSKFNPHVLTPEGFWDLDFPPTQESFKFDV